MEEGVDAVGRRRTTIPHYRFCRGRHFFFFIIMTKNQTFHVCVNAPSSRTKDTSPTCDRMKATGNGNTEFYDDSDIETVT